MGAVIRDKEPKNTSACLPHGGRMEYSGLYFDLTAAASTCSLPTVICIKAGRRVGKLEAL